MKKLFVSLALILILCMAACTALAADWYCPKCGYHCTIGSYCPFDATPNPFAQNTSSTVPTAEPLPVLPSLNEDNGTSSSIIEEPEIEVWGLTTAKLAARTGPSTSYTEPGTFPLADQYVRILTVAYDAGGTPWVQCEVEYKGSLMRIYTGLKRFDRSTFDLALVPDESDWYSWSATVNTKVTLQYGPGEEYAPMKEYTLHNGRRVIVTNEVNDWVQIEFTSSSGSLCRGWIPRSCIR